MVPDICFGEEWLPGEVVDGVVREGGLVETDFVQVVKVTVVAEVDLFE